MAIPAVNVHRQRKQLAGNENATNVDEVPVANEERQISELVIGLMGSIGSGASTTAKSLAEILEREFSYSFEIIKIGADIDSG